MKKIVLPLCLFFVTLLTAQNSYILSTTNETYEDLNGSISLNNGEIWDDPDYSIPIGFTFSLGGKNFSIIYLTDLFLGGVLVDLSNPMSATPLVAPILQDIVDLGVGTGTSLSNISYKTEGDAGNRILKIEWNNVGFIDDSTASDFINFQVWFYEGSNNIEYRYGPSQINNPTESYEDETGLGIALVPSFDIGDGTIIGEGYALSGNPVSPTLIILDVDNIDDNFALDGTIPSGTVYRFESKTLALPNFEKDDFKVYPNPVSNTLKIKYKGTINTIRISNQLGQQIFKTTDRAKVLDISDLKQGVYFIDLDTDKGFLTKKFIKQ